MVLSIGIKIAFQLIPLSTIGASFIKIPPKRLKHQLRPPPAPLSALTQSQWSTGDISQTLSCSKCLFNSYYQLSIDYPAIPTITVTSLWLWSLTYFLRARLARVQGEFHIKNVIVIINIITSIVITRCAAPYLLEMGCQGRQMVFTACHGGLRETRWSLRSRRW